MRNIYDIEPRIVGDIYFGDTKRSSVIYAGKLAEKGTGSKVSFDGSNNFVVLEVGKRGSGKSYGMGSLLEGFATSYESKISSHKIRKAVLLLDPLDIHWTAVIPLSKNGPEKLKSQYDTLNSWKDIELEPINASVWIPAGFNWNFDNPLFHEFYIPVSTLDANDWSFLLKTDLILEPRGRLIYEAYNKVIVRGWENGTGRILQPKADYTIQDLIDCVSQDKEILDFYGSETIRSVIQPLVAFNRMPLFSKSTGTPVKDLIVPGRLSILSLGRLESDLRTVLTTVIVRKLRKDRMMASQISRRLAFETLDQNQKNLLEYELNNHIPDTILAIDEAQILLPQRSSSSTRKEIDSFVLEGRNYGLSLWMSTQRPKGAISEAAISQIDTFIVHKLSVEDDINAVCNLLQSSKPDKIRKGNQQIGLSDLIRSLEVGQALISSASSNSPRLFIINIRPRMVAHGGDSF